MMARPREIKPPVSLIAVKKKMHQTSGMNYSIVAKEFKPLLSHVSWLSC